MKKNLSVILLASVIGLTGCATIPTNQMSYVSGSVQSNPDTASLCRDVADFLATKLPPAKTTLLLEPVPAMSASNSVTPALQTALRQVGFGVAELSPYPSTTTPAPSGIHLRYLVTPLDHGVSVRLYFDGLSAAKYYPRTKSGKLGTGTAFMILKDRRAK